MRIGGLVLAAGEGRRFGGPKQVAEVRGRPMLQRVLDAALGVAALDPVVVVLGAHERAVRERIEFGPAVAVSCAAWAEGQSASLRCGVDAVGEVEALVVLLGDQPFITSQAIAGVLDWDPEFDDAVRAFYDGVPGHPVLLGRALLERVGELTGDAGFRALLEGARVRRLECGHLCDPADIDTREELEVQPRSGAVPAGRRDRRGH